MFYEETTSTLLCGDLFTAQANSPALTEQEIVSSALAAEDVFRDLPDTLYRPDDPLTRRPAARKA
jgi:hypothetical protein